MSRLPMDPSSWGALIMRTLIQQSPSLEPHIQFVRILDQDPEGNGYGIIPLSNGSCFIPFVVQDFDLKPIDTLVVIENGEEKFRNLTEANAIMAVGGIGMGKPVTKNPIGLKTDQELNMLPPRSNIFGRRLPPTGVMSSITPVKLAARGSLSAAAIEGFLKEAAAVDPSLPAYLAVHYQRVLAGLVTASKEASEEVTVLILDPKGGRVDVVRDGVKEAGITLQEAASLLREQDVDGHDEKIASLALGRLVILAGTIKQAATHSPHPMRCKEPGWYRLGHTIVRVMRTRYLDGKASSMLLAFNPSGHRLSRTLLTTPADAPDSSTMKAYYHPAELNPGELCFLFDQKTQEASIPFRILEARDGGRRLTVSPLLGDSQTVIIHFGDNNNPYSLGHGEIALPKKGYSAFRLAPKDLNAYGGEQTKIRIYKGGGVYGISEGKRPAQEGLTRGQVVALLIHRYGLDPEAAMAYLGQVMTHTAAPLMVDTLEEDDSRHLQGYGIKIAAALWGVIKEADGRQARGSGAEPVDLDPNRSGPNREEQQQAPSGPGANPAAMIDQGAGIMPDIPFMKEVADTMTGFATGTFTSDELSEIYNGLIDKLLDVQDLVGRILIMARLGKIEFVTEGNAKRLLDESDKFRSALMNADMLLRGVASIV